MIRSLPVLKLFGPSFFRARFYKFKKLLAF